jgi:hypothetical protein
METKEKIISVALVVGGIKVASDVWTEAEKLKGYWDESGLDMHIAVKRNGMVAVSTKHWGRTHYILTGIFDTDLVWSYVQQVSLEIGRTLIRSEKGPYVYVPKLTLDATQAVFNKLKELLKSENIERNFEWSWNIDDAVLPSDIEK